MQFLRPEKSVDTGEYKTLNELSENSQNTVLKAGQPFYDIKNNKLYIGDGEKLLKDLSSVGGSDFSLTAATSNSLGGIKLGYASTPYNRAVQLNSNNQAYVNIPSFSLPTASETVLGGIKMVYKSEVPTSYSTGVLYLIGN